MTNTIDYFVAGLCLLVGLACVRVWWRQRRRWWSR